MNLLFKRNQSTGFFSTVIFKLWARMEITEDDLAMIKKYKFYQARLVEVDQPGLLRNSILLGLFCFAVLIPIVAMNLWRVIGLGWVGVIAVSAILGFLAGFIAYHQLRETIYVKDLIHGRYFKCRSVIALARKEAYLETITAYFRQVLETAKYWGDAEARPIEALEPEDAKRFILTGPLL